eukprot:NODE_1453_length_1526_cov_57.477996_g1311_i0.p1 GENE.NODE_1453_length_1526_cov_57.477996_g1311_i0~~NODE_1453_length_1526_cov_57.477996_g1311_i0.p1  ORF type:complete len:385 (-),score=47.49 NODE_1453_length_1526_cov_57.477996_g1311_i0:206-1360(-)
MPIKSLTQATRSRRLLVENVWRVTEWVEAINLEGRTTWLWNHDDHLPCTADPHMSVWDCYHTNSIQVLDGFVYLSMRWQYSFFKISLSTKRIVWMFGNPHLKGSLPLCPESPIQDPRIILSRPRKEELDREPPIKAYGKAYGGGAHNFRYVGGNRYTAFLNRCHQNRSCAAIMSVDEGRQCYSYVAVHRVHSCRTEAAGSAQLLPSGSVIAALGSSRGMTQVGPDGSLQWHMDRAAVETGVIVFEREPGIQLDYRDADHFQLLAWHYLPLPIVEPAVVTVWIRPMESGIEGFQETKHVMLPHLRQPLVMNLLTMVDMVMCRVCRVRVRARLSVAGLESEAETEVLVNRTQFSALVWRYNGFHTLGEPRQSQKPRQKHHHHRRGP